VLAEERPGGNVRWALSDQQGSVRDVIDNAGNKLNQIRYDSFGTMVSQSNPNQSFRFGYTGRDYDAETGMNYYRSRYYDPKVGRFISEDSIGFAAGDTNLSRYVFNSPTNYTDPSGMIVWAAVITGGVIAPVVGGMIAPDPVQSPTDCDDQHESWNWLYRIPIEMAIGGGLGGVLDDGIRAAPGAIGYISGAAGPGALDDWLAAGTRGGLRRNLGAWRTSNFRNNSTRFYHGTSAENANAIRSSGIDLSYTRPNADFGSGFYVSSQKGTALWSSSGSFAMLIAIN
jgi:RHS repeat-associated protein